jgi:transcription elongation GreA/GreB family factor
MQFSQLRTVNVHRPGVGKRYSILPVDHVDITGFHVSYEDSPFHPRLLDIQEGDTILWQEKGTHYQATIDEVVVDGSILRVAFRDAKTVENPW